MTREAIPLEATLRPSRPCRLAMRAVTRTVAIWGAFMLAVVVSSRISAWSVALLLIGLIFGAAAFILAERR